MLAYKIKSGPAALSIQRDGAAYFIGWCTGYDTSACLALAGAAEQLDLLLALVDDGLRAGSQQLAGVEALALLILASLDVLAGGLSEDQLALGVDVDLGDAQADGLCDHLVGDAGAAMQDQRNVIGGLVDAVQSLEVQALPVGRVDTVDVADAGCQEVDAQIGDL